VPGAGCQVPGAGCRVPGAGCRVPGAGCRVLTPPCSDPLLHRVHLQNGNSFNCIVTKLGGPVSGPNVDLAKLLPRQQWILWFYFDNTTKPKRTLEDICSVEEFNKLTDCAGVATPVEQRSLCPGDYYAELTENVDIAINLKNGSSGGSSSGDVQEHGASDAKDDEHDASDAISESGDDNLGADFLFGSSDESDEEIDSV
jgi:hypothetical protein